MMQSAGGPGSAATWRATASKPSLDRVVTAAGGGSIGAVVRADRGAGRLLSPPALRPAPEGPGTALA